MPNPAPATAAPAAGFPDPAKNNADVAAKLLDQDLVNTPPEVQPASDALDHLAEEFNKKKEAEAAGTPPPPKVDPNAPEPSAEEKAAAEAKAAEEAAAKEKADAEAKAKTDAEAGFKEQAEKLFKDSPGLPANASPKSSEAFSAIKIKAAQEISAREAELTKLREENAKLAEKLKNPVPPEVEKEIQSLREWRAKLDVDSDPKFKEFDKNIAEANEFIYSQLLKNPAITQKVIDEIKGFGGPSNVKMDKIFEAIKDPSMQRLIESKLADIEMQKYSKDKAISAAKENLQGYLKEREEAGKQAAVHHNTVTKQFLDPMIKELKWFARQTADDKADDATKKNIEEHNKFVETLDQQLTTAYQDDSPQMRAILLVGMAQLFNLQREHKGVKAELEATKKSLAEITAKWEKVKGASTSRLRESAAPSTGVPKIKPADNLNTRPADALDALAKQVMEERNAKGV